MANDLTVTHADNPGAMPLLEGSEFKWLTALHPQFDDKLPAPEDARKFLGEAEAVNAPISTADLEKEISRMVLAYPQKGPEDSRGYILALAEHVGEYPHDVVAEACRRVVRGCKFIPAVAELVEVCEELVERRRRALGHIRAVEHVRTKQVEYREKLKRLNEVREREIKLHKAATDKLCAALSAAGEIPMGTYDLGLGSWFRPLREAALHDVAAEWGELDGNPSPRLPEAVAGYVEHRKGAVVLDDDWPPEAPEYPKDDEASADAA